MTIGRGLTRTLLVASVLGGVAPAWPAEETARDTAHYSADRPLDVLHMKLELDFTGGAIDDQRCTGRVEYTLKPRGQSTSTVHLAAGDMEILGVELAGKTGTLPFSYDDRTLSIELPAAVAPQDTVRIVVDYELDAPPMGLHFVLPGPSTPDTPKMVYTYSEPLLTRYWVPSHDWPNERWTSELLIRVPDGYSVVAHGVPAGEERDAEGTTFHWESEVPLDPHMMGFVIGELVELKSEWRGLTTSVHALEGTEAESRYMFRLVGEMLDFLSETIGVDYPFEGYRHVTVHGHEHGGMEQAGFSILDPLLMSTGLDGPWHYEWYEQNYVAHMMVHQWFGGIVNYRSIAQMWLNEGFASLLDTLWITRDEPPGAFAVRMWERAQRIATSDAIETGEPMVNRNIEDDLSRVFSFDGGKVYDKGSWVLNMLRHQLGDELFWKAVGEYLNRYRWQGVESADLRRVLEQVSGRDLIQFFAQWVDRPGIPHLDIATAWDVEARQLIVTLQQTQLADATTPAFAFPLELYLRAGDEARFVTAEINSARHELRYDFEVEPSHICVDPHGGVLKRLNLDVPRAVLTALAMDGPTPLCRLTAVEELANDDRKESLDTLAHVLLDAEEFWIVRTRAAAALGKMQTRAAEDVLVEAAGAVEAGVGQRHVLASIITALGEYVGSSRAADVVTRHADPEQPLPVEAAAIVALGQLRVDPDRTRRILDILLRAVDPSTRRWVRWNAFDALVALDDPRAFDRVLALAQPGSSDRLRGNAIRTLGALGRHDELRDRTRSQLTAWLYDPDMAAQQAAIDALGRLGDPRTIVDLERIAGSARAEVLKKAARGAVEAIVEPDDPKMATSALLERLAALEKKTQELEQRLAETETAP